MIFAILMNIFKEAVAAVIMLIISFAIVIVTNLNLM
jgi:hypothetical protein